MYPTVRPGDVLRVQPTTTAQIEVGDLAVCRRPGYLFCHRVIEVGKDEEGGDYILTRPDTVQSGSDGPTSDEDLLGIVTAIKRDGEQTSTEAVVYPWLKRRYLNTKLALIQAWSENKDDLIAVIHPIQENYLYRALARLWLKICGAQVNYQVCLPVKIGKINDLYQTFDPDEFEVLQPTWQGQPPVIWKLILLLDDKKQPAAQVCLALHPADCPMGVGWHAHGLKVRARYRGMGLEEDLLEEVERILMKDGLNLERGTN